MGKLSEDGGKVLPEFRTFLMERKLAPGKNIPYLAYWVSRFLAFPGKRDILADEYQEPDVLEFLENLRNDPRVADWQVRQADDALRLYFFNFLRKPRLKTSATTVILDVPGALHELKRHMRMRHYSYSTERTYQQWVERFLAYVLEMRKKSPPDVESADFRDFLSYLAMKQNVSASTQNQAFNAVLFLFRYILGKDTGDLSGTVRAKRGERLPVVLTVEEVKLLFKQMSGLNLLLAELLYGAGVRLMELVRLRVQDIDFYADTLFVRRGKGDKDRSTILPATLKERLNTHIAKVKAIHEKDLAAGYGEVHLPDALGRKYLNAGKEWAWQYAFPSAKLSVDSRSGKIGRYHISDSTIQEAVKNALRKSGVAKHASVHTLRLSFATHLLQAGVNIREVQDLLGHKNVETTMIYTHVLRNMTNAPKSPLDSLYSEK
jgi:integron integrase